MRINKIRKIPVSIKVDLFIDNVIKMSKDNFFIFFKNLEQ